jgi:hypothetical protein
MASALPAREIASYTPYDPSLPFDPRASISSGYLLQAVDQPASSVFSTLF